MSEALQQKVEERRKAKQALQESIAEVEKENSQVDERNTKIDNLRNETKEHQDETAKLLEYVKEAKAEVAAFPSDAQMLKLERRLESLKNQMRESDRNLTQRKTGIQAYEDRLNQTTSQHKALFEEAQAKNQVMSEHAATSVKQENEVVNAARIHEALDILSQIVEEREAELSSLQSQLVEYTTEEADRSARIRSLQEEAEAEGPRIEAQKEKDAAEIRAEWEKEHKFLQQTYDRLYDINKEQQYHLSRGTHIKRKAEKKEGLAEASLSQQQGRLASDINEARGRLKDVSDELGYTKRQTEAVRNQGRNAQANFKQSKEVKEEELARAADERQDIQEEGAQLRQAKADLGQLLTSIRDS